LVSALSTGTKLVDGNGEQAATGFGDDRRLERVADQAGLTEWLVLAELGRQRVPRYFDSACYGQKG
jgi:hypothetical protein